MIELTGEEAKNVAKMYFERAQKAVEDENERKRQERNAKAKEKRAEAKREKERMALKISQPIMPNLKIISWADLIQENRVEIWKLKRSLANEKEINGKKMIEVEEKNAALARENKILRMSIKSKNITEARLRKMLKSKYDIIRALRKPALPTPTTTPKVEIKTKKANFTPLKTNDELKDLFASTGETINRTCPYCKTFNTTRLAHFKEHVLQSCSFVAKIKNVECEVCAEKFTYRGIQQHFDMYVRQNRKTNNGHQLLTQEQHKELKQKYAQMYKNTTKN